MSAYEVANAKSASPRLAALDTRLRRIAIAIVAASVVAGAPLAVVDVRALIAASAFIIGWTQLAGL